MNEQVHIYDAKNINTYPWADTDEAEIAKRYLVPFISEGVDQFIENVHAKMILLRYKELIIPVTVNDQFGLSSFVSSPYGQYVTSASVVSDKIQSSFLRYPFQWGLNLYGHVMRIGKLDQVVIVNNWLLTTNPYLKLDLEAIEAITTCLKKLFPCHAIVFRSIVQETCHTSFEALVNHGYRLIPSKQVYVTDATNEEVYKTRIFKSDLKFIREKNFEVIQADKIQESDLDRIQELYQSLYIDKYALTNPRYNKKFIALLVNSKILNIIAIKNENVIEGVAGYLCRQDRMISPFFGYDPIKSENSGLYRYLSVTLLLEAQKHQAQFNQSAGGSFFKKVRRAEPRMEYTAIYENHLPFYRRLPWSLLEVLMNRFGKRAMEAY